MKDNLTESCNSHIYISENLLAPCFDHNGIQSTKLREWSLIKWRGGGYKTGGGEASEVLPLQKREGRKCFSHAQRGKGGTTNFEVVLKWELEV